MEESELFSYGVSPACAKFTRNEHEEKLKFFSSPEYQRIAQAIRDFMENFNYFSS